MTTQPNQQGVTELAAALGLAGEQLGVLVWSSLIERDAEDARREANSKRYFEGKDRA